MSNPKAVSFINGYCVFADGLLTGLENYLAENIILDWFGKTIKCRSNVADFMNIHKVNSRHILNSISSTTSIGYTKKPKRVRVRRRSTKSQNCISNGKISYEMRTSQDSTPKTPANKYSYNNDRSRSSLKSNFEESSVEESDITFELNDDDGSKVFKLEKIQSTNIDEIEEKISQISLEDRVKLMSPRKRNFIEVDEYKEINEEDSSMNYIEAYGEIIFSKSTRRLNGLSEKKIISSNKNDTWRKPFKLQVAYTSSQMPVQQISNEINTLERSPKCINDELVLQRNNCDSQNNFKFNHTIHVIIYEGRSRCRVNLSKKFNHI